MAGSSTLTGSGWQANPTPDTRFAINVSVAAVPGQPAAGLGKANDLVIDTANRVIYENVAGTWSAGTSY
ncbi:hypothetical protein [Caballeronia sp. dw_19]|uniref:hypothetical protein n=1 Tax=Caballeronia sp. dw_19 TaxID=2719791 RepID=UPI001BD28A85|nr:hypothetical protein [Caballeronia sp. dw_19]